ncbi:hypothetical protein BGZ65_001289 [Modicella reniformis]|uniref:Uncharacterized protein n=1 Tax=Modicella reniformis TaxID=1440133 RepID=A0A9P6MA28_9FUNG|nr:hypothetical protein BGZ65_001289 [Modicella reniformis]
MITASQISFVGPTSASTSTRLSQLHTSARPKPTETAPSQVKLILGHDPAKYIKSSELERNIILPTAGTGSASANAKNKRKQKYTPPLISGGYAEKLVNLMNYHKSEYTIWANATLRQDKLVGSTEPLAVVEITEISRDHHLLWTQCSVIYSEHNRPPFDVDRFNHKAANRELNTPPFDTDPSNNNNKAKDQGAPHSQEKVHPETTGFTQIDIVPSTQPDCIEKFTQEDATAVSQFEEEDSISGLHMDVHKMGVVPSLQGSVLGGSQSHFTTKLYAIHENTGDLGSPVQFVKSSQGSDDEAECDRGIFFMPKEAIAPPKRNLPEQFCPPESSSTITNTSYSSTSPIREPTPKSDNVISHDEIADDGADRIQRSASAVSAIDDRSSNSGSTQTVTSTPQETISTSHISHQARPSFTIIFSNLFNWTTLKVTDRVEIHEPCRKIAISEHEKNTHGSVVWIVERYKVISD